MTTPDHRTRVAADKRERMRMRLIENALLVFARQGADATAIEHVISTAGVSRGTFYNYFRTHEELVGAVLLELGNELLALVDTVVLAHEDPALRLACGVRMVLHTMRQHSLLPHFVAKVGIQMVTGDSLAMQYLPRDLAAGIAAGRFDVASIEVGLVLVFGTAHAAICALTLSPDLPDSYPEDVTYHLLLGLGMTRAQARKLVSQPIEAVAFPENALLSRTQHTHIDRAA